MSMPRTNFRRSKFGRSGGSYVFSLGAPWRLRAPQRQWLSARRTRILLLAMRKLRSWVNRNSGRTVRFATGWVREAEAGGLISAGRRSVMAIPTPTCFERLTKAFPARPCRRTGATQQGVGMTEEEIWQVISYIRSVQVKAPAQPAGNAVHGKELFYGSAACSMCHMIQGKGGRLGPDLSTTGSARSTEYLVESVRSPSRRLAQGISEAMKEFSQEYETVTVVTADGTKFLGVVLNEDHFTLQMIDTREQMHLFEKDKLRSWEKSRESLMPAYDQKMLNDKDMQDVIAYLLAVGAQ